MSVRRAVLLSILVVALLGAGAMLAAWTLLRAVPAVPRASLLRFDVPDELEESLLPFRPFSPSGFRAQRLTVWDVTNGLRRAARDPRIEALVLHIDEVHWGWAKVAEVREAVLAFREAGKPVYASLRGGGEREYLLASAADRLCLPPTTSLQLNGLSATALFYRGAFDKFGISPNFASVGRFKSGVETYTQTRMSAPSREALGAVLDDHFALLLDTLAAARAMTPDSVRALIDRGPFEPAEAQALGLVDTLLHASDVDSIAAEPEGRSLTAIGLDRYLERLRDPVAAPRIALVVVSGTLAAGRSREHPIDGRIAGAETLIEALREARSRSSIRAVVLRIDSPGGEADASDEVAREVERCRAAKPLIASMSDYAASGGYYIAVAAESLVAEPATLTGSIGVFGGKLNVAGLLAKLGLGVESVSRGRHAGMLSPYEDFTPEEADLHRRHLESFYGMFLSRVAGARHLSTSDVDSIGQGRVWTGLAAERLSLVDRLGGIERALEMARARAGIGAGQDIQVETFPRPRGTFLSRLVEDLIGDEDASMRAEPELPPVVRSWIAATRFPAGAALALMPWSIEIR